MIIKQYTLDPKLAEVIESNNQHESLLQILSQKVKELERQLNEIRNENMRRKSMDF